MFCPTCGCRLGDVSKEMVSANKEKDTTLVACHSCGREYSGRILYGTYGMYNSELFIIPSYILQITSDVPQIAGCRKCRKLNNGRYASFCMYCGTAL